MTYIRAIPSIPAAEYSPLLPDQVHNLRSSHPVSIQLERKYIPTRVLRCDILVKTKEKLELAHNILAPDLANYLL
jgi:hypothetical protein